MEVAPQIKCNFGLLFCNSVRAWMNCYLLSPYRCTMIFGKSGGVPKIGTCPLVSNYFVHTRVTFGPCILSGTLYLSHLCWPSADSEENPRKSLLWLSWDDISVRCLLIKIALARNTQTRVVQYIRISWLLPFVISLNTVYIDLRVSHFGATCWGIFPWLFLIIS